MSKRWVRKTSRKMTEDRCDDLYPAHSINGSPDSLRHTKRGPTRVTKRRDHYTCYRHSDHDTIYERYFIKWVRNGKLIYQHNRGEMLLVWLRVFHIRWVDSFTLPTLHLCPSDQGIDWKGQWYETRRTERRRRGKERTSREVEGR